MGAVGAGYIDVTVACRHTAAASFSFFEFGSVFATSSPLNAVQPVDVTASNANPRTNTPPIPRTPVTVHLRRASHSGLPTDVFRPDTCKSPLPGLDRLRPRAARARR